jgi:hypothetical protein
VRLGSGFSRCLELVDLLLLGGESRAEGGGGDRLGGLDTSGAVARYVVVVGVATLATLRSGGTGGMEGGVPMHGVGTCLPKVRIPSSAAGQPGWGVAGRCVGKCRTISCSITTQRSREVGTQSWFELGIRGVHGFDGLFGHYLFTLSNHGEAIHQPPRPLTVIPTPFPEAPGGTPRNPAKADSSTSKQSEPKECGSLRLYIVCGYIR